MIFVTVGAQMPFDRLIRTVDEWAEACDRTDVFAQIGSTPRRPRHVAWRDFLRAEEYRETLYRADLVIAHAGMGSIISALELGKPILVMPRRAALRETRTDHQVGTAKRLSQLGYIRAASDEQELRKQLDHLDGIHSTVKIDGTGSSALVETVREFIDAEADLASQGAPGECPRPDRSAVPQKARPHLLGRKRWSTS